MIHFERTLEIDATPDAVWAVVSRYMHIDEYAPEIKSVEALTEGENRVGSKRRNTFNNGKSMAEEVTEWDADRKYHRFQMSEMDSMPLHEAFSSVAIEAIDDRKSLVRWDMDFRVKYGPFGWLMGQTMMKMMMSKILDGNLKGLADKLK